MTVQPIRSAKPTDKLDKGQNENEDHNIRKSTRFQKINGDPEKRKPENFLPTTEQMRKVLNEIGVRAHITKLKRQGEFGKNCTNFRMFLVSFSNKNNCSCVLAIKHENKKELAEIEVYLFLERTKEDSVREIMCLRKRRKLINDDVPKENWKIRNFELFNDAEKVEIESSKRTHARLNLVNVLHINTRSLLNITRRSNLSDSVTQFDFNMVCLTQTVSTKKSSHSNYCSRITLYRSDREIKTDGRVTRWCANNIKNRY